MPGIGACSSVCAVSVGQLDGAGARARKRWPAGDCSWEEAVGRFSSGEFGGELNHEQGLAAEFIQEVTIVSRHLIASFARHRQDGCVSVHELAIVTDKCLSSHHDVRKVLP